MQDHVPPVKGFSNRVSQLVEDQSQADRDFFDKHPDRSHRIRLAHPAEIAEGEHVLNQVAGMPQGHVWYVAVRCISQGNRIRIFFSGPPGFPGSLLSESQSAEVYESVVDLFGHGPREVEAAMRGAD